MDSVNELLSRGVEKIITKESLESKLQSGRKLRIKYGIDPTTADLHLGYAVLLEKLRQFQQIGHLIIFLIGDFTARFGDPSDRLNARLMRSKNEVCKMAEDYLKQVGKILDLKKTEIRSNGEWYDKMSAEELMRLQWHFTYAQLIERDLFQERIKQNKEIHYPEIGYPILQGYDSVVLKADLAVCGSDQLFNEMQGRILQEKFGQPPQDIMTMKLLLGTDGKKMSQSAGNVISIDEESKEMFGQLMNLPDNLMPDYFEMLVRLPIAEIKRIQQQYQNKPRELKAFLAKEIVKNIYGEEESQAAAEEFNRVFRDKQKPAEMPLVSVKEKNLSVIDLLLRTKLAPSRSEARRLIEQGGVRIDGMVIGDANAVIGINPKMIIQVGKRRFAEIK